MSDSLARLDLTEIFCDVDDFYQSFENDCNSPLPQLPHSDRPKSYRSRLSISEVMTIVIASDDRKPVPEMAKQLSGKLFGDKGYVSQALFEQLYEQGLELIARRKNEDEKQFSKTDGQDIITQTRHY